MRETLRAADHCATCGLGGDIAVDTYAGEIVECQASAIPVTALTRRARGRAESGTTPVLVGAICDFDIVCAEPETPVFAAQRILRSGSSEVIVVIDDSGWPVGIVTARDLLAKESRNAGLKDVMTTDPITVAATDSIAHASELMLDRGARHLVVLGWGGAVIGVLSPLNVMKATA